MQSDKSYEYLVIGAGPAGLQLGYYMQKAGWDYLLLEGDEVGSFFEHYPRHRKLISINKIYTGRDDPEYNLRHDWNSLLVSEEDEPLRFGSYSNEYFPPADAMVSYLRDYAERFHLRVQSGFRVVRVTRRDEGGFAVESAAGERLECRRLIIATGVARPFIPDDVPGIDLAEGYEDVSVDPQDFVNQSVLILGKGNSAFETADNLIPTAALIHLISPQPVRLAWETHFVGHLRAVNNNLIDTYQLKSQNAIIDGITRSIERTEEGKLRVRFSSIHARDEIEQIEYDRLICCTGFRVDDSIFAEDCKPKMVIDGRFPELNGSWESTNVPGLHFVGTASQSLDYKRSQSAFIHGFRYNARTLYHLLAQSDHGEELPWRPIDLEPETLARAVLERMSRVSSLWQQVGFLCDVIAVPEEGARSGRWYRDLNPRYVLEQGFGVETESRFYMIQFRFGEFAGTVFDNPREAEPYSGELSAQIHPVVELYRGDRLQDQHHVLEDFLADWNARDYWQPLADFFAGRRGRKLGELACVGSRVLVRDAEMRLVETG
jgi:thioredoxin reductase